MGFGLSSECGCALDPLSQHRDDREPSWFGHDTDGDGVSTQCKGIDVVQRERLQGPWRRHVQSRNACVDSRQRHACTLDKTVRGHGGVGLLHIYNFALHRRAVACPHRGNTFKVTLGRRAFGNGTSCLWHTEILEHGVFVNMSPVYDV